MATILQTYHEIHIYFLALWDQTDRRPAITQITSVTCSEGSVSHALKSDF